MSIGLFLELEFVLELGDAFADLLGQRLVALFQRLGGIFLMLGDRLLEPIDFALDTLALGHDLGQLRLGLDQVLLRIAQFLIQDPQRLMVDDGLAGLRCGAPHRREEFCQNSHDDLLPLLIRV